METSERLNETNVSIDCLLKPKGLVRGVLWKLALFEADQFAEHEPSRGLRLQDFCGIERPSSRDHVKTFNLDTRAGACVEGFVRLVHPAQLQQASRLLLPQCGRGKRRRTERIGGNSQ